MNQGICFEGVTILLTLYVIFDGSVFLDSHFFHRPKAQDPHSIGQDRAGTTEQSQSGLLKYKQTLSQYHWAFFPSTPARLAGACHADK